MLKNRSVCARMCVDACLCVFMHVCMSGCAFVCTCVRLAMMCVHVRAFGSSTTMNGCVGDACQGIGIYKKAIRKAYFATMCLCVCEKSGRSRDLVGLSVGSFIERSSRK